MCGSSELGRSLVKEFQVSTREHNTESNDFKWLYDQKQR